MAKSTAAWPLNAWYRLRNARRTAKVLSFYVFPGPGKSGYVVTIQHSHERAVKKSGVDPFEFYCWRHIGVTRWSEAGMDKHSVDRLMGHSSPRVAERY